MFHFLADLASVVVVLRQLERSGHVCGTRSGGRHHFGHQTNTCRRHWVGPLFDAYETSREDTAKA
jgi:hypothetical protein